MKIFTHLFLVFLMLCLLQTSQTAEAQTLGILGNGTSTNGQYDEPAPFQDYYKNSRKQYLFTADELSGVGMVSGSIITQIGWEITALNGAGLMEGYTIRYKWTTLTSLTSTFETGSTIVYGPTDFTPTVVGNVDFTLTTATTTWNGTDNLLIEICEGSLSGDWTMNCSTPYTTVAGSVAYYLEDSYDACSNISGDTYDDRPNTRINFTGESSCLPPTSLVASNITSFSADISWTASISNPSGGYDYYYSTSSTPPTVMTSPSGSTGAGVTTTNLTGLTANTTYYFWVRSNCGSGDLSSWAGSAQFSTGYCIPSSTSSSTYINNFSTTGGTTNISNLASGYTVGGYQDNYSTQNATIVQGGTLTATFSIVGGTAGVAIWVDLNNNLIFETTERLYNSASYLSDGTYTVPITIPGFTSDGQYAMRILTDWNATSPTPCSFVGTRGEAEDYKVTVAPPPPTNDECSTATTLTVANGLPTNIVIGDIGGATASTGVPTGSCNTTSNTLDIWYQFVVPSSGSVSIELFATGGISDSDNDYSLQAFSGSCGSLVYVACDEDGSVYPAPSGLLPQLTLTGQTSGSTIYLRVRRSIGSAQSKFAIGVADRTVYIPVATGECDPATISITPASGNAYRLVPLLDASGGVVAELFSNGQDLGIVTSSVHHNTGPVRTDAQGIKYMNVDHKISVQNQPAYAVNLGLYMSASDLSLLMAADPSVTGVESLKSTKTDNACGSNPSTGGILLSPYATFTRPDGVAGIAFLPASFSNFYLHGGSTPLPVVIKTFTAIATASKEVMLAWSVTQERDLNSYLIERSADGKVFSVIGTVDKLGNEHYNLMDKNPLSGSNYYRLISINKDGSREVSSVRVVNFGNSKVLALYPSPADNAIFITGLSGTESAQVSVYNQLGQLVQSKVMNASDLSNSGVDIHQLIPGIYTVKVQSATYNETLRFVKQ